MKFDEVMWLYRMGMHDTLKLQGFSDDNIKFLRRKLYSPDDVGAYYAPYIPAYYSKKSGGDSL